MQERFSVKNYFNFSLFLINSYPMTLKYYFSAQTRMNFYNTFIVPLHPFENFKLIVFIWKKGM